MGKGMSSETYWFAPLHPLLLIITNAVSPINQLNQTLAEDYSRYIHYVDKWQSQGFLHNHSNYKPFFGQGLQTSMQWVLYIFAMNHVVCAAETNPRKVFSFLQLSREKTTTMYLYKMAACRNSEIYSLCTK